MFKIYASVLLSVFFVTQVNAAESTAKEKKMIAKIISNFAKLDADGDGALSEKEIKSRIPQNKFQAIDEILSKLDSNADGKVTKDELEKVK